MKFLRLFFRTYQRQNVNFQDYFRDVREKYGSSLTYSDIGTVYFAIDLSEVSEYKKRHYLVAEVGTGYALVIKEMTGQLPVDSEAEALDIASQESDYVYAEYVNGIKFDRAPS